MPRVASEKAKSALAKYRAIIAKLRAEHPDMKGRDAQLRLHAEAKEIYNGKKPLKHKKPKAVKGGAEVLGGALAGKISLDFKDISELSELSLLGKSEAKVKAEKTAKKYLEKIDRHVQRAKKAAFSAPPSSEASDSSRSTLGRIGKSKMSKLSDSGTEIEYSLSDMSDASKASSVRRPKVKYVIKDDAGDEVEYSASDSDVLGAGLRKPRKARKSMAVVSEDSAMFNPYSDVLSSGNGLLANHYQSSSASNLLKAAPSKRGVNLNRANHPIPVLYDQDTVMTMKDKTSNFSDNKSVSALRRRK